MAAPARSDHVALLLGKVLHVWGGLQVRRITHADFNLYPSAVKVRPGCKIDPRAVCHRSNRDCSDKSFFLTVFGFAVKTACKFPTICCLQYVDGEEVGLPNDEIWLYDLESGVWWDGKQHTFQVLQQLEILSRYSGHTTDIPQIKVA